MITTYYVEKFWDNEYKHLIYIDEPYNDPASVTKWKNMGYTSRIAGHLCDMRQPQPSWNHKFIELYESMGWKDIGTAYYRMDCGTVMPTHQDHYKKYIEVFNLQGKEDTIYRAVVFMEDWASGHYFESPGKPVTSWQAGFVIEWQYDVPHMAANIGPTPRYTLQITGHK
jgi:hypothetical protein